MPRLDGYALARRIREAEEDGRRMPIVALTANALHGESDRCLEAGMDAYLSKPVVLNDLRAQIDRWLGPDEADGDGSVLSMGVLRSFVGDDPEELAAFLQGFQANAARLGTAIEAAWQARDLATLGGHAHTLKSSARMVGAVALADLCESLENSGRAGNGTRVAQAMAQLRGVLGLAVEAAATAADHAG
jgi:HPt (histidine-containing phosphotransfer) domain-containing protein